MHMIAKANKASAVFILVALLFVGFSYFHTTTVDTYCGSHIINGEDRRFIQETEARFAGKIHSSPCISTDHSYRPLLTISLAILCLATIIGFITTNQPIKTKNRPSKHKR